MLTPEVCQEDRGKAWQTPCEKVTDSEVTVIFPLLLYTTDCLPSSDWGRSHQVSRTSPVRFSMTTHCCEFWCGFVFIQQQEDHKELFIKESSSFKVLCKFWPTVDTHTYFRPCCYNSTTPFRTHTESLLKPANMPNKIIYGFIPVMQFVWCLVTGSVWWKWNQWNISTLSHNCYKNRSYFKHKYTSVWAGLHQQSCCVIDDTSLHSTPCDFQ